MLLDYLALECDSSPSYLFNAFSPLEISRPLRDEISSTIRTMKRYKQKQKDEEWRKKLMWSDHHYTFSTRVSQHHL